MATYPKLIKQMIFASIIGIYNFIFLPRTTLNTRKVSSLATSRPRRFGVRWQAEAGGPGATPLFLPAPKAVSLGIPLLPRNSTAGATAGAAALQNKHASLRLTGTVRPTCFARVNYLIRRRITSRRSIDTSALCGSTSLLHGGLWDHGGSSESHRLSH